MKQKNPSQDLESSDLYNTKNYVCDIQNKFIDSCLLYKWTYFFGFGCFIVFFFLILFHLWNVIH